MDGQTAVLQVLGQLKITDLMIYVLAAGGGYTICGTGEDLGPAAA